MIVEQANNSNSYNNDQFSEREIMYKMLFDMKNDINDLKQILFKLMQGDNVSQQDLIHSPIYGEYLQQAKEVNVQSFGEQNGNSKVVIQDPNTIEINEVEESLSLEEKEKELVKKALIKHNGKRKNAASDLGISERTLYRKIKEFNLD